MSSSCRKEITLHPQAKELLLSHFRTLVRIFKDVLGHLEIDYMAIALLNPRNELMFLSSAMAIEINLLNALINPLIEHLNAFTRTHDLKTLKESYKRTIKDTLYGKRC